MYKENEEVHNFCCMIDRLVFLPIDEVVNGMAHLKDNVPEELRELLNYFDTNYISGKYQMPLHHCWEYVQAYGSLLTA